MNSSKELSTFLEALTDKNNLEKLKNNSGNFKCPFCNNISFKTKNQLIIHTIGIHMKIPHKTYEKFNQTNKNLTRDEAKKILKYKIYGINENKIMKSLGNDNNFQSFMFHDQIETLLNNNYRSRSPNRNNGSVLNLAREISFKDLEDKINYNQIPLYTKQKINKMRSNPKFITMKDLEELSSIPISYLPEQYKLKFKSGQPKSCVFCGQQFTNSTSLRRHIAQIHNIINTKTKHKLMEGNKNYKKHKSMQSVRCPFEWCSYHNTGIATPHALKLHLQKKHLLSENNAYNVLNIIGHQINRRKQNRGLVLNLAKDCVTFEKIADKIHNQLPIYTQQKINKMSAQQKNNKNSEEQTCITMKDLEELSTIPDSEIPEQYHSKRKPILCVFCGKTLSKKSFWIEHINRQHNIVSTSTTN